MNRPRYLQISDELITQIDDGTLLPGAMLPTESELQKKFGVSRVTIRKSMKILVDKDLLYRVRGSGTYVKSAKAQHNAFQLNGFYEEVSAQGKQPSSKLLTFELIESDIFIANKLGLNEGDEVYSIIRLRLIDGEPEILEHTFMPVSIFPDLSIQAIRDSKYEYVEKIKGLKIKLSRQSAKPELVTKEIANNLNIEAGHPVIRVDSVGELSDGRLFEYTEHYFRVYQYSFDFVSYRPQ
ncbi:GntR family transcriptional regulator [Vibrio sp. 1-Bac 57]|uniref:GntR family transcriptional regulator n=1 Tax=Psychromonas arctica TaxID=168275 RepID=UPI000406B22C|nr:GntR family transcriptional regulator [Psychromonas arctica]